MKEPVRSRSTPLYRQIYHSLKTSITNGTYAPDTLLPSERELGILYQVDRITVRKALELLVEEGLVIKYPGAGTRVVGAVTTQSSSTSNTILYILPKSKINRITEPFHSMLFYQLEAEFRKHNYMLAYTVAENPEAFRAKLSTDHVAGLLFASKIDEAFYALAEEMKIPFAILNNPSATSRYASFVADDEVGAYLETRHLIDLGHKSIAMISGASNYATSALRQRGVERAMEEAGLNRPILVNADWTIEGGFAAMESLIQDRANRPFTAVVVGNDNMAFGAIRALRAAKLNVPSDVSIVGFDDMPFSSMSDPALTTVQVDVKNMAKNAARYLFDVLTTGEALSFRLVVPVSLIIRDSTAALPDAREMGKDHESA